MNLYLPEEFAQCIVPALRELVGSRITEVLSNLQKVFLEDFEPWRRVQEGIQSYVSRQQDIGQTIAVSRWDRDRDRNMAFGSEDDD